MRNNKKGKFEVVYNEGFKTSSVCHRYQEKDQIEEEKEHHLMRVKSLEAQESSSGTLCSFVTKAPTSLTTPPILLFSFSEISLQTEHRVM